MKQHLSTNSLIYNNLKIGKCKFEFLHVNELWEIIPKDSVNFVNQRICGAINPLFRLPHVLRNLFTFMPTNNIERGCFNNIHDELEKQV